MHHIKALLLGTICTFSLQHAAAQMGCTDMQATNYNSAAVVNDGSCIYAYTHYNPPLRAVLPSALKESSGLIYTKGSLWTLNDSGNPDEIYRIDTNSGAILQTVVIDNYSNNDWEEITADSGYIYVSDCGNNSGNRRDLKILKIAKSNITTASTVHLNAQAINISYTDQTSFSSSSSHNFDCEAIISRRDSIFLFTKNRGDLKTKVYGVSKIPGTYALAPIAQYDVAGLITGASYNETSGEIALIGYSSISTNSFMYLLYDYVGNQFFSGNKRKIDINNGGVWQTEAITYMPTNRFMISCEKQGAVDASIFIGAKTWLPSLNMQPISILDPITISPIPADNKIWIEHCPAQTNYTIIDANGKMVKSGAEAQSYIDIQSLSPGQYSLQLNNATTTKSLKFIKK